MAALHHAVFKKHELTEAELGWLRDFRCRDARCFKASDRAEVMQAIRDAWGSEETFDTFMRMCAPSFPRYSQQASASTMG